MGPGGLYLSKVGRLHRAVAADYTSKNEETHTTQKLSQSSPMSVYVDQLRPTHDSV
jgi:hypothetical protein